MKIPSKILSPLLALGLIGGWALARAADEKTAPADDAGTYSFPGKSPEDENERGARGGRAGAGTDNQKAMMDKLNLTPDQQKKIAEIRKKYAPQLTAARGNRGNVMALMKKERDEIRAVLTPDQQKQFDQMPAPGRGGADGGRGAAGRGRAAKRSERGLWGVPARVSLRRTRRR